MISGRLAVVVAVVMSALHCAVASCPLEARSEWGALPPVVPPQNLTLPVPYVVIHHSYIPGACPTRESCFKAMRSMQHTHQKVNGWNDIGYNFAIGGDGNVYEGRGWDVVGAHAKKYNSKSIGICFIGDYTSELPPANMLEAAQQLIQCGIARGSVQTNYTLVGHRQVRDTECPGSALYREIQGWSHWRDIQTPAPQALSLAEPSNTESGNTVSNTTDSNVIVSNTTDSNNTVSNTTDSNIIVSNTTDSNNIVSNTTDSNIIVSNTTDSNIIVSNTTDSNIIVSNIIDGNSFVPETTDSNIVSNITDIVTS